MPKIATVKQMRALEAAADSHGVSYARMMELAGAAVFETVRARVEALSGARVVILAGLGNNGGDGLVAGRLLAEAGAIVQLFTLSPRDSGDENLRKALRAGVEVDDCKSDAGRKQFGGVMRGADVFVDALFGTGARLPIKGRAADLLAAAGAALRGREGVLRVAVDCPSGFDCDSGALDENLLPADVSVTFGAAKVGQFLFPGADALGELVLADIGWPPDLPALAGVDLELASAAQVGAMLPKRLRDAHKGTFGAALVVAGSVNYAGAAYLAAAGAYRVGAGLVTVGAPGGIHSVLATLLPEATWLILPSDMGVISAGGAGVLQDALSRADALLLGPGWGTEKPTAGFLSTLLLEEGAAGIGRIGFGAERGASTETPGPASLPPTVVDADGLKLLAALPHWPRLLPAPAVLTPHPGEMAHLTGLSKDEIQADRVAVARRFADEWGHVLVLKGAFTVVAAPDGSATLQPFATAALARAGTGDVLAGLITGLLAQGLRAYPAAVAGAFLHGLAGELAATEVGAQASVLARDVLALTPKAIASALAHA
ncbi:MAG: NAD(P)H-hydrate dehydratase [Anaerolineales bacterium]|jgi:NAD(P)H-hydrate epimerase|nr:NAD(P)H-hydrate dehydratase [Anaerolineales bacterium]MDP7544491.1 NAD(P)H-hydrate dehydratase [Anaerolineales bacterium]MDP7645025.1 NAD(P)H-hydrate dehydratase [Anaerolineales bacterium]